MINQTIRSTEPNFNSVARRGMLAGAVALAVGATAPAPRLPTPFALDASPIVAMARRVKEILDRELALEAQRLKRGATDDDESEERTLYLEQVELSEKIVSSSPSNPTEALLVAMYAIDRISYGVNFNDCHDVIERGERALRRAHVILAQEMAVDLKPFGGCELMPARMCQPPAGRA